MGNLIPFVIWLSLSLGQFSSLGGGVYIFDLLIFGLGLAGLVYRLRISKKLYLPKIYLLLSGFCVLAFISIILNPLSLADDEMTQSAGYLIRLVGYLLSGIVIFNLNSADSESSFWRKFLVWSAVFVSVAGFIQLLVLPDLETLSPMLGWDPHKNRLVSTFFDPNFVSGFIVIALFVVFDQKFFLKPAVIGILLSALLLTFSRSGWAMFGISVLVYGLLKDRRLVTLAALLAFSAYFFVPRVQTRLSGTTDPADSAKYRLISWANAIKIYKEHPVFGVGYNSYKFAQLQSGTLTVDEAGARSASGADSTLLLVLATTGLVGFTVFVSALIGLSLWLWKNIFVAELAILAGVLVHSLFVNSLVYPQIMFALLVVFSTIRVKRPTSDTSP